MSNQPSFFQTLKQLPVAFKDIYGNGNYSRRAHDTLVNAGHGMLDTSFALMHGANTAYSATQRYFNRYPSQGAIRKVYGPQGAPDDLIKAFTGVNLKLSDEQARRGAFLADWEEKARQSLPDTYFQSSRNTGASVARFGGQVAGAIPAVFAARSVSRSLPKFKPTDFGNPAANALSETTALGMNMLLGLNAPGAVMFGVNQGANALRGYLNATGGAVSDGVKNAARKIADTGNAIGAYSALGRAVNNVMSSQPWRSSWANTAGTLTSNPLSLDNYKWLKPDVKYLLKSKVSDGRVNVPLWSDYFKGLTKDNPVWKSTAGALRAQDFYETYGK